MDDMERKLTKPKLDDRMMSAASFVNRGDVVADVGTDHGYLPIYLILSGIIPFAVASDIREGPLGRARKNARKYGVDQKMKFELSDGLAFLEDGCPVDDIIICGMGGETIISIIEASDYPKKSGVRLILQPMTKAFELREYLYSGGFEIMDEMLSESGGKIYSCMLTRYTGKSRSVSFAAKMLGEDYGKLLSFLHRELFAEIVFCHTDCLEDLVIREELFVEVYGAFAEALSENGKLPSSESVRQILYWFASDYADLGDRKSVV